MEIGLTEALQFLRPGSQFVFTDEDYSTIQWHVLEGEAPNETEIVAAIKQVKANRAAELKAKETARAEILNRLGLTAEEAAILLS
jgi:hypothetical protein